MGLGQNVRGDGCVRLLCPAADAVARHLQDVSIPEGRLDAACQSQKGGSAYATLVSSDDAYLLGVDTLICSIAGAEARAGERRGLPFVVMHTPSYASRTVALRARQTARRAGYAGCGVLSAGGRVPLLG